MVFGWLRSAVVIDGRSEGFRAIVYIIGGVTSIVRHQEVFLIPSQSEPIDILILTNGPGEITTWVKPVVKALRQQLTEDRSLLRISAVVAPCANASGTEAETLASYPEIDRTQAAEAFYPFLFWGKTAAEWDWRRRGVVIFLGGDQFFTMVIARRLGYRSITYVEWSARWLGLGDRFALMNDRILAKVTSRYHHKCTVVGDLMVESQTAVADRLILSDSSLPREIGFLPGSKSNKLSIGVPFMLAVGELIQVKFPDLKLVFFLAPTVTVDRLATFANPATNPAIEIFQGSTATLQYDDRPFLLTSRGTRVEVATDFPAYGRLQNTLLCVTTIGANTAELGALAVPAIAIVPTQQLEVMRSWDGILGIIARLPLLGIFLTRIINQIFIWNLKDRKLAWPNIWAGREIIPEVIGEIVPAQIADIAIDLIENEVKLENIKKELVAIRGNPGAATKIAEITAELIDRIE
jgi:hypothetical protein